MKKFVMDVVRAAAVGFAVGAVLASVGAPIIAGALGLELAALGTMANPMFMGLFAGSWGALGAAMTPVINTVIDKVSSLFGKKSRPVGFASPAAEPVVAASVAATQVPDLSSTHYQDMVASSRDASLSHSVH